MAAYNWVDTVGHKGVPTTALRGGTDVGGQPIYVGKAFHKGDWIPAKVIPHRKLAFVPYGGKEIKKKQFQVLCKQQFDWVPSCQGHVPPGALIGGKTSSGENLYIGRVRHRGSHTVGKVHPSHRCCYIPYDGQEVAHQEYEILVLGAYNWVDTVAGQEVPTTALRGGTDVDGQPIYVGKAFHEGDWIPAKVIPDKKVAYVAYGGKEIPKSQFQVLCEQQLDWVPSSQGHVPPDAVIGGKTSSGENLYIGRVRHMGSLTVGKVQPSRRCCYIPFNWREVGHQEYEILVLRG